MRKNKCCSWMRTSFIGLLIWGGTMTAHAQYVWHCTRTSVQVADASDNFTLASLNLEVIQISIRDLYAAYQGHQVMASGQKVSACFMDGNHETTKAAMRSLGVSPQAVRALSRSNQITPTSLFLVKNEQEMMACMDKHAPAIGYLSEPNQSAIAGPCF